MFQTTDADEDNLQIVCYRKFSMIISLHSFYFGKCTRTIYDCKNKDNTVVSELWGARLLQGGHAAVSEIPFSNANQKSRLGVKKMNQQYRAKGPKLMVLRRKTRLLHS